MRLDQNLKFVCVCVWGGSAVKYDGLKKIFYCIMDFSPVVEYVDSSYIGFNELIILILKC